MKGGEKMDDASQRLTRSINQMINNSPELRNLFASITPRQANYRYYHHEGSKDRYFYTTTKINHKGHKRFVVGIYRYLKGKKAFKLVKKSGFAKKQRAIETARAWSER